MIFSNKWCWIITWKNEPQPWPYSLHIHYEPNDNNKNQWILWKQQQQQTKNLTKKQKHFTEHMEVITLGNRSSVLKVLILLKILWEKQIPRTLNLWTSDIHLHREVGKKSLLGEWSLVESMGTLKWMPGVIGSNYMREKALQILPTITYIWIVPWKTHSIQNNY